MLSVPDLLHKVLCECAPSFAQRYLISKRLQFTHQMNEVLWHYVERAVQCADARIDGQDKVHTDPFFFSIPDRHTKKTKKTPKQQLALGCCKNCLHCQESTIDSRNESASSQFAVPDSFKTQGTNAVAGATCSNTPVQFHIRDHLRQTQIRLTGFRIFLLDFCSSKHSRSTQMSVESYVILLTTGEASDPSSLGYDGKPSQENVTSLRRNSACQRSNFVLTTNLQASMRLWRSDAVSRAHQVREEEGIVL